MTNNTYTCSACNLFCTATSRMNSMNSKMLGQQCTGSCLHTPCSSRKRWQTNMQLPSRLQAEVTSSSGNNSSSSRSPVLILPGFLSNNTTSATSQYRELADNLLQLGHPEAGGMSRRGTVKRNCAPCWGSWTCARMTCKHASRLSQDNCCPNLTYYIIYTDI